MNAPYSPERTPREKSEEFYARMIKWKEKKLENLQLLQTLVKERDSVELTFKPR